MLDDRLTFSETTTLAGDLIGQFPNLREVSDGFIGSLSSVLQQYPRQVCLKCADPRRGISRAIKFLSISELVNWLEKETEPMRRDVSREQHVKEQLQAREDWQHAEIPATLKDKGKAWLDRTDPIAAELTTHNLESEKSRRAAGMAKIEEANRAVFERECKAEGIDPARGISPSLLKTFGGV